MGRNGTRENRGSSSALSLIWRMGYIRIAITVVISAIVTMLCCIMWKSAVYASAVAEIGIYIPHLKWGLLI